MSETSSTTARRKGWVANLIPHEYVHSWCGKFRRPAGMCTADFQTPLKTRLLWVYEGLTEYLGEVLMVRSGLVDPKEYREIAHGDDRLARSPGRPAVATAGRYGGGLLPAAGPQPELERAEARAGLLLRGGPDLAGGRRHHPRTLGREEEPGRLLPEIPGSQPDRCLGRSLRAAGDRQRPARAGRLRLGIVSQPAGLAAAGVAAAGRCRPVRLSPQVCDRASRRLANLAPARRRIRPRFAGAELQPRRADRATSSRGWWATGLDSRPE